jgi:hypothetical protein
MPTTKGPLTTDEWARACPGAMRSAMPRSPENSKGGSAGKGGSASTANNQMMHSHNVPVKGHMRLDRGMTRPYKVMAIPPDIQLGGRGPLLSAYHYDRDMLWARASQFHQLCMEVRIIILLSRNQYIKCG